ncbi:unnamed protein product [Caenorhabditis bovis]|uniref:DUF19 domain-containing protein n=1 Tax=Caenorhabditis bovis TaxID=2654633 RepID=A0A8S1F1P5_9PELO|nr:unnamed protein product [Caenorhabditis bovis]
MRTILAVLLCFVPATFQQMIRECSCAEIQPCLNAAQGGFMKCADKCQNHVAAMGANYPQLRQCILAKEPAIAQVAECSKNTMRNACSNGGGGMVRKRYPETLKLAAFTEINGILTRSGIQAEAKGFLSVGKKFATCVMKCMDRGSTGSCYKKLGCGLDLPPDSVVVRNTKQCAIQSGFNTAGVRQLCNCVAASGVRNLAPLCNRIVIS